MATTYLQAVNEVLGESNEVELTAANFASAVGVQSVVKRAVNKAYLKLVAKSNEWPFLATAESNVNEPYSGNVTLETVIGQRWYLLKTGSSDVTTDFLRVDWNTFSITTNGATGAVAPFDHNLLEYTTFEHWRDKWSRNENAEAADTALGNVPLRVVESQDGRYFGLSPIPDKVYKVYFTAWDQPTKLSASTDAFVVPDMYMHVVTQLATYYLALFKKDWQEAQFALADYKDSYRDMHAALLGNPSNYMRNDKYVRRY